MRTRGEAAMMLSRETGWGGAVVTDGGVVPGCAGGCGTPGAPGLAAVPAAVPGVGAGVVWPRFSACSCAICRCFSICGAAMKYCQTSNTRPDRATAKIVFF